MIKQTSAPSKPDLADLLAMRLPPPTPAYEPDVEITAGDLAKRNNWGESKAAKWLRTEADAGRWQARNVLAGGKAAKAYRPVAK